MSGEIFPKSYRKAIKGVVGGRKLSKDGREEEFVLPAGDPKSMDQDSITIQVNTKEEEEYLKKMNKPAFVKGILISVKDYEMKLDVVNSVSDGELKDILKMPFRQMKKRVLDFTSTVPLSRLLEIARDVNKPIKTIQFIEDAMHELEEKPRENLNIRDDNIKVGTV